MKVIPLVELKILKAFLFTQYKQNVQLLLPLAYSLNAFLDNLHFPLVLGFTNKFLR